MGSLRWILLLAGVLFIAGLAWWERWRPRQARGGVLPDAGQGAQLEESGAEAATQARVAVAPAAPARAATTGFASPDVPLRIVELPAGQRIEPEIPLDVPVLSPAARVEPGFDDAVLPGSAAGGRVEPQFEAPASGSGSGNGSGHGGGAAEPPSLVVEWPPEAERRIVNLRVVPVRVDRFAGRALRQSLTAAGFAHGRFGIFHLPGPGGRVVVSAASLTRPGLLDPDNMDFQRFGGLNLFAVLPGPLSPAATVDRLVDVACDIAQRLEGRVQDEEGMPLDVGRLDGLRRAAGGETAPEP